MKTIESASVLIPTYKGASVIVETLSSFIFQLQEDDEVIICDDGSGDDVCDRVKALDDPRIKVFLHKNNLGYPGNLNRALGYSQCNIVILMGQDDIVAEGYVNRVRKAFGEHPEIGAISRNYYWFDGEEITRAVRAKPRISGHQLIVLRWNDSFDLVKLLFGTLDQLSGLAFRRDEIRIPFHDHIFPCHVYPFAEILRRKPVGLMPKYEVAVRIATSQTRFLSSIYAISPVFTWALLFETLFSDEECTQFRKKMIKEFVADNYIGLIQVRCYGSFAWFGREVYEMIKRRPLNLIDPRFLAVALLCILMPRVALVKMVDAVKCHLNAQMLPHIKFRHRNFSKLN
jgi:glycosyltransferase involved in cell wall biosynthesis